MSSHWEDFYSGRNLVLSPSQFAEFVAASITSGDMVLDIGCGDGRDSVLFSQLGYKTIAADFSISALKIARIHAAGLGVDVDFKLIDFSASATNCYEIDSSISDFRDRRPALEPRRVVVYSRFFIHAIDDECEANFFNWLRTVLCSGDLVFVEYRTSDDADEVKFFGNHFRRFVDSEAFLERGRRFGFEGRTIVKGKGLAPFRNEDPIVCRQVLTRM